MRAFTTLLTLGYCAITALADGASIVSALNTITTATANLNDTVIQFRDAEISLLALLPIVQAQNTLLSDIKSGTKTAQASSNLTTAESISVYTATEALVAAVNETLTTIEETKPEFDSLLIVSPIILSDLKQDKSASDALSSAIIAKVPTALQSIAESAVAPIDAKFTEAIDDYEESSLL